MTTRVISDTHFWHHNIIEHCGRPIGCDQRMWDHLDSVNCDLLIHLGDVAFRVKSEEIAAKIVKRLPGNRKVLIVGNHDKRSSKIITGPWNEVVHPEEQPYWLEAQGLKVVFQHKPFKKEEYRAGKERKTSQEKSDADTIGISTIPKDVQIAIHGHIHELGHRFRWIEDKLVVNACVEHWDYRSFTLEEVVNEYYSRLQHYSHYSRKSNRRSD